MGVTGQARQQPQPLELAKKAGFLLIDAEPFVTPPRQSAAAPSQNRSERRFSSNSAAELASLAGYTQL
jgi:hypothetical protein